MMNLQNPAETANPIGAVEITIDQPVAGSDLPLVYGLAAKVLLPRPAFGFKVDHDIPDGVTLIDTKPSATCLGGHIMWNLGRVDPGQEIRLQVIVAPEPDRVISPQELATFTATYTQNLYFETPIISSRLRLKIEAPPQVEVGEEFECHFHLHNGGNWILNHLALDFQIPEGLETDAPAKVVVDEMLPKENRTYKVKLSANQAGTFPLSITAQVGDKTEQATAQIIVGN
ncbi:MAG: hypothetical protein R3B84_16435 [Zavarzinella sp.]